jgi:PAS domain S-box-containing protein
MSHTESLSVLVVDDSDFFGSVVADKLESNYGMATRTATTASKGLEELREYPIDCVVSDYEMPETTGLEFYEQVSEGWDVPFVLLTGRGDEEIASRAISMGVDEYLQKQSVMEGESFDLLVNRIQTVVGHRQTQQKYQRLVDNSPDSIAQLSVDGEILAANDALATELGESRDTLLGAHLSEFLPADVAATRLEEGQRALTTGTAVTFQDNIGVRHFHNIVVPLPAAGGEDSIQLVSREITHQKRNEQELAQKGETLAMINRIVRHDINNDVQLLKMWSDNLEGHVDEEGQTVVGRIQETTDHIGELTATARDFVQSLESNDELELEQLELTAILETEIDKTRATAGETAIRVETLPNVAVRANELLSSVFRNLLSNAIRHNDADDPTVTITVETTDTTVTVFVADNGPGVPDDRKDDIFGRGEMGPDSPGTGIGLYLVSTLVDQYNGRVWVEDNDPTGAVFAVELPKISEESAETSAPGWGKE